ncbi:MAG: hypothetical protein SF187_08835 [Deltaproteobacteria bacterium]|nr:hypothetical protein [Deltaproteobacteria bacterium]
MLLASRVVHAQAEALPSIVLSAAPDVPLGLVARMRGELTAAGLPLGSGLPGRQNGGARVSIVIRQTGGELIAELEAIDETGATQMRALSVPFVPGDAADVAEAGSELAVRTTEVLRTQLTSRTLDLEPSAVTSPPKINVIAAKASPEKTKTAPPPWLLSAGAGVVSGFISGQTQVTTELNAVHVWRSGFFTGLAFLLPFTPTSLSKEQGTISAEAYVATVDGGFTRSSGRWRWSGLASAGLAVTNVDGNAIASFVSNKETTYAFVAAAGGNVGVTVAPHVMLLLQARLMTLQPRPGIRVAAMNTSTAAWVLPSASVALGVSW